MNHENIRPYNALARASRVSEAWLSFRGVTNFSPRVTELREVRNSFSLSALIESSVPM